MAPSAMSSGNHWTKSLSDAQPVPYWLDDPGRPHPEPALTTAETDVATEPYQAAELRDWYEELRDKGLADGIEFLDVEAVRAQVDSPTFQAGLYDRRGVAMVNPAQLAWGLKRACLGLGVRIHGHT